jgi:hypothetical protein
MSRSTPNDVGAFVEEHRRRKGSPVTGDSTRMPQMTAYRQKAARRGQRSCPHVESSAGLSDICSGCCQDPSGRRLWLVRADRTWALRADIVRSRRISASLIAVGSRKDARIKPPLVTERATPPGFTCWAGLQKGRLRPIPSFRILRMASCRIFARPDREYAKFKTILAAFRLSAPVRKPSSATIP